MNTQQLESQLRSQSSPCIPVSRPPTVQWLDTRVTRRRKRRGQTLALVAATGAAALVLLAFLLRNREPLHIHQAEPTKLAVVENLNPNMPVQPAMDSPVQVLATFRDPVPVFGLDRETNLVRHLGWIESEQTLPVDLSGFSADQQEQFKSVLFRNETTLSL